MRKIAIFASYNGSGFDALYDAMNNGILDIDISFVMSNNTNAKVLEKAQNRNIKNYLINDKLYENSEEEIIRLLKENNCEFIFLSGYMKKISSTITNNYKVINSHPSLLPDFGGVGMYGRKVHEAVIHAKVKTSGVTVHEVNENYDEGKVILQKSLDILESDTVDTLEDKIKDLERTTIVQGVQLCLK